MVASSRRRRDWMFTSLDPPYAGPLHAGNALRSATLTGPAPAVLRYSVHWHTGHGPEHGDGGAGVEDRVADPLCHCPVRLPVCQATPYLQTAGAGPEIG